MLPVGIVVRLNFSVSPILSAIFGPVQNFNPATPPGLGRVCQGLQGLRICFATVQEFKRRFANGFGQAVARHAGETFVDPGNAALDVSGRHGVARMFHHLGQQAQVFRHGAGPRLGSLAA